MKSLFSKFVSQLLVVCMIALPFSTQAALVGTDQVVASAQAQANRDKVRDFLSRGDVQKHFEMLGLSPATAKDRVNALTDQEIQQIAGKIDTLPAGASSAGTAWAVLIVVAIVIWLVWK